MLAHISIYSYLRIYHITISHKQLWKGSLISCVEWQWEVLTMSEIYFLIFYNRQHYVDRVTNVSKILPHNLVTSGFRRISCHKTSSRIMIRAPKAFNTARLLFQYTRTWPFLSKYCQQTSQNVGSMSILCSTLLGVMLYTSLCGPVTTGSDCDKNKCVTSKRGPNGIFQVM